MTHFKCEQASDGIILEDWEGHKIYFQEKLEAIRPLLNEILKPKGINDFTFSVEFNDYDFFLNFHKKYSLNLSVSILYDGLSIGHIYIDDNRVSLSSFTSFDQTYESKYIIRGKIDELIDSINKENLLLEIEYKILLFISPKKIINKFITWLANKIIYYGIFNNGFKKGIKSINKRKFKNKFFQEVEKHGNKNTLIINKLVKNGFFGQEFEHDFNLYYYFGAEGKIMWSFDSHSFSKKDMSKFVHSKLYNMEYNDEQKIISEMVDKDILSPIVKEYEVKDMNDDELQDLLKTSNLLKY